jgi:hypothetical protein
MHPAAASAGSSVGSINPLAVARAKKPGDGPDFFFKTCVAAVDALN